MAFSKSKWPFLTSSPNRWIAVWCTRAKQVFGRLQIINDESHEEVKVITIKEPATGGPSEGPVQPQTGLLFVLSMWLVTYHIFPSLKTKSIRPLIVAQKMNLVDHLAIDNLCWLLYVPTFACHPSPDVEDIVGQKVLGSFTTFFSEVSGTVVQLDEKFLLIKEFNYDGKGLAPIFIAGTTGTPGGDGEVEYT